MENTSFQNNQYIDDGKNAKNFFLNLFSIVNPQTGLNYEYFIKDDKNLEFVICAVFNLEPKKSKTGLDYNKEWFYSKGRLALQKSCFRKRLSFKA
jgi:hypothetical protein